MAVCFIGIDSPNQTECIYAQVLRDELGYEASIASYKPLTRNLLDFMRERPETIFVIIGSAEMALGRFLVFHKFMEVFQVVSKDGLKALLSFKEKAQPDGKN